MAVGADYTAIPCAAQISVLSEVLLAWLILPSGCLRSSLFKENTSDTVVTPFVNSEDMNKGRLVHVQENVISLNCKWHSSWSKRCTVNISPPSLSLCTPLIMQFLLSPRVALKFKTPKWRIIEGMSLMVHSLSVQ